MQLSDKIREKLKTLPDKPGCYLMRDKNGKIIYIGKARSLRKRVRSYFRDSTLRRSEPKLRSLVQHIDDLDIIVVHNEAAAILTEGKLIKSYRPQYNISLKDDKRFLMLRAHPKSTFPKFTLVRIKRDDNALYFGPYASSNAARTTLDFIEKHFGLRKCTPRTPDAETHKHCINDIVRFCSAPCINKITPEAYRHHFEEACAFLRGQRPALLKELHQQMQEASKKMQYERAAGLRDTFFMLQKAIRQHASVAATPQIKKESALRGIQQLQKELNLPEIPRVIEAFDISNISGTYAVASMVCAVDGIPQNNRYRHFRIKTVTGSDDPAMIAEAVRRRINGLLKEKEPLPNLMLLDGGITQLRAARQVLDELGCPQLPTAGLAKRYEEIVCDDGREPLQLELNSDALKVLRRLRDEAHRFAITYHRKLRNRRIRESALDDIPGIGEKRKTLLLKHFGSTRRILNAGPQAIAALPGIGKEISEKIIDGLKHAT